MKEKRRFHLALVGTDSLRGREVKSILGLKKPGNFDLEFYDPEVREEFSKLTEFKKEPKVIHGLASGALDGKDLVFLAADRETNRAIGFRALEIGQKAIDLGESFSDRDDVPLVVAGVNDGSIDLEKASLVSNPHPASIILSHLFRALRPDFGVDKAVVVLLQPASAFDDPGIQELASQSVALLNGAKPKKKVFKEQVAFNILSHTAPTDANGFCQEERRVAAEIRRVLGPPVFPLFLSIVQAPVFHTYSIMAYLELGREADIASLQSLFQARAPFRMAPFREACTASSISVSGKDDIFIGQIKKEEVDPCAFWIWLVADNLTRGSAVNAFDVAKKMLPIDPGRAVASEGRPKSPAAAPPRGGPRGAARRRRMT
jgi:aspartate-semialdehyde dehydrogenase